MTQQLLQYQPYQPTSQPCKLGGLFHDRIACYISERVRMHATADRSVPVAELTLMIEPERNG